MAGCSQLPAFCLKLFFEDSAEVEDHFVVAPRQGLERVVGCEEDNDVGFFVGFFVVGELEHFVLRDVWLDDEDVGVVAALHHFRDDVFCRRFAKVVDVGLERQPHHGDAGLAMVFELEAEHCVFDFFGTPERFVVVDFARFGDELRLDGEVGRDEIGVDCDAVSAHAASRLQDVDARMLVGEGDEFPYVDSGFVADERKLVGEGDLHVARGVFRQLAHFCGFAVCLVERALHELAVKADGFFGRFGVHSADDAVVVDELVDDVARENAFGTVGNVDFAFQLGAQFEDEVRHFVGSPDGRRRFDHVEVAFFEEGDDGARGGFDVGNVGLVVAFERGGDYHEVGVARFGCGRCAERAGFHHFLQHFFHSGLYDVEMPFVCHFDYCRIDINSNDFYAVLGGDDGCGKSDVSQAHETCFHFVCIFMVLYCSVLSLLAGVAGRRGLELHVLFLHESVVGERKQQFLFPGVGHASAVRVEFQVSFAKFVDCAYDAGGIACDDRVFRDGFCHNGSSCNQTAFSNGHSRHYLRSASDVGKIFDCVFPESVVVGHFVVQHACAAMGMEMHAACDSDIVPNFDQVGLGGDEDVAVDVAIVAYFHSHAAKRPYRKEFEQKNDVELLL